VSVLEGKLERRTWLFLGVAALVFASRLPFLAHGFGLDNDATLLVFAGRRLALEGTYLTSRFPGYPVPELVYALAWRGGPLLVNGLTALMSAVAAGFFALVWRRLGGGWTAWLAGVAVAFVPTVYIQSTTSMDYGWALAFLCAGVYAALEKHPVAAGILLGIGGGCRLTVLPFAIPLALLLLTPGDSRRSRRSLLVFAGTTILAWLVAFSPVLATYGLDFWHHMPFSRPLGESLQMVTTVAWGHAGVMGLLVGAAGALLARFVTRERPALPESAHPQYVVAWVWGLALGLAPFALVPIEVAYVIPAVPFVLWLLGTWAPKRTMAVALTLVLISPFVALDADASFRGALLADAEQREIRAGYVEAVLEAADDVPEGSVVAAGYLWTAVDLAASSELRGKVSFERAMGGAALESALEAARESGGELFYLPEVAEQHPGTEELRSVARPLEVGWGGEPLPLPQGAGPLR
jgi:hypothetical protein